MSSFLFPGSTSKRNKNTTQTSGIFTRLASSKPWRRMVAPRIDILCPAEASAEEDQTPSINSGQDPFLVDLREWTQILKSFNLKFRC